MGRTLRIIAIIVGVLLVIVIILPFIIPVNQFRPTIEEKASTALGRKVQIGNLSLSLLSGSLAADNLSIADDPRFNSSPFLTAKSIKVGVELMPLVFSKDLRITDITIDSPEVMLIRNREGQWNYSSLAASQAKSAEDQAAGAQKSTQSSGSAQQFSIQKLELKNGRIIVGSTVSQKRSTYDNVTLVASNLSPTSQFPLNLTGDLPGGGKLKLEGAAGPLDAADMALTPAKAKLSIASLDLAKTGFLDPSAGLGGLLDLDAQVESQNGEADVHGAGKLTRALLVAGGSPAAIPVTTDIHTKYNLRKNSGVLEPSRLKIGNAVTHLAGTYEVEPETTAVKLKIDGQDLPAKDLEAFLPALGIHMPSGASLQSGTLSADLNVSGPTNRLVTTGNVGAFKAKLAGFDLGSKLAAVSKFAGLNTGRDLDIDKLTSDARIAPDGMKIDNFNMVVPSLGTLVGAGTIDAHNNLDFKMAATLNKLGGTAGNLADNATGALGGILGKMAGRGNAGSAAGCKNSTGPTVPFLVKGTTKDPKFLPDAGGVAAGLLKSQLGCAASSLAPNAAQSPKAAGQPATPETPANPVDTIRGLFKKKKP